MPKPKSFGPRKATLNAMGETLSAGKSHEGRLHFEAIALNRIQLDPENPRQLALNVKDVTDGVSQEDQDYDRKNEELESIKTLAQSIKKEGVLNPVIVYKEEEFYRLVAGERRVLASLLAKEENISVKILDKKPDPSRLAFIQWVENMERENLSLWEKIVNIEKILEAMGSKHPYHDVTPSVLGNALNYSKQRASVYLNVASGNQTIKRAIKEGKLNNIKVAALLATAPLEQQSELLTLAFNGATIEQLREYINTPKNKNDISQNTPLFSVTSSKVKFGTIKNVEVAKSILLSVLENPKYESISYIKDRIDWQDVNSINKAFKVMVRCLEKIGA